jgi:hypothetical protein
MTRGGGGADEEEEECFVQFALPTTEAPYQHFNCEVFVSFTSMKLDIQRLGGDIEGNKC